MGRIRHSVVIPTYNQAQFIARALESVLRQADDQTEIVVVDDGSTDNTGKVVASVAGPISYVRTVNRGPAAARNRGVKESRGEFVLFLDSDDALLSDALDRLRLAQKRWPAADIFCGGYVSVTRSGRFKNRPLPRVHRLRERNFRDCISGRLEPQIGATAICRRLLQELPFAEQIRHGEDIVLFAQAFSRGQAQALDARIVAKFDHPSRLRYDTTHLVARGLDVVDELFNSQVIPADLMRYRDRFAARHLLTLARAHYQRKEFRQSVNCYHQATLFRPVSMLRWNHLRKYIRSLLHSAAEQRLRTLDSNPKIFKTTRASSS